MISEGSRDTEDWSNDPENSALYHRNTGKCINNEFIYIYIYIICSLGALKGLLSKKCPNVLMVMCVY